MWKLFSFLKMFREDLLVMLVAIKDPRTPLVIKGAFLAGLLYCISPIDIIPDAVPLLGMVDDAAVLPAAVFGLIRLLPPAVHLRARVARAPCLDRLDHLGHRFDLSVKYGSLGKTMDFLQLIG